MRILIIGFGSIGNMHASVGTELGHDIGLVSSQRSADFPVYATIPEALTEFSPDAVIIASPTSVHEQQIQALNDGGFGGRLLVEKPLFANTSAITKPVVEESFVAYNLRYHPVVLAARQELLESRQLTARFYVGQYLPSWRPTIDYRDSYSASRELGGGALRDLSHELDLIVHLMGPIERVCALVGKRSSLEISSDDTAIVLFETVAGAAGTVEMNYLDRQTTRTFGVNLEGASVQGDLVNGTVLLGGERSDYPVDRKTTYRAQLKDFCGACVDNCTYAQGLYVVSLIEAIEKSSVEGKWIAI